MGIPQGGRDLTARQVADLWTIQAFADHFCNSFQLRLERYCQLHAMDAVKGNQLVSAFHASIIYAENTRG